MKWIDYTDTHYCYPQTESRKKEKHRKTSIYLINNDKTQRSNVVPKEINNATTIV
jgi:hypothetical protein